VAALFGTGSGRIRTDATAVELALDLTPEAVILCERKPYGSWRKFASARLDDPEFATVIGLLRVDAETYVGARVPVRLWLPPEQVLKKRARIGNGQPASERVRAAFDHVAQATVYRPQDVAVAVGPADADGTATILITFAETWREAREYAARWGFVPGPVSTRHHAEDFGPDGPEFLLWPDQPPPPAARRRWMPLILGAAVLGALAAGAAVLALRPWEQPPPAPPALAEAPPDVATAPLPQAPAPAAPANPPAVALQAGPNPAPAPVSQPAPPPPSAAPESPAPAPDPRAARPDSPAGPHAPDRPTGDSPIAPARPPPQTAGPRLVQPVSLTLRQPPPALPRMATPAAVQPEPAAVAEPEPDLSGLPPIPIPAPRPGAAQPLAVAQPATAAEPEPEPDLAALPPLPVPAPRRILVEPATAVQPNPAVVAEPEPVLAVLPPIPTPAPRPDVAEAPASSGVTVVTLPSPELDDPPAAAGTAIVTAPLPKARPVRSGNATLIGIINLSSGRKALLRLPDGRFRTVTVGDDLNGWRVSMIGTDAMRVSRGGKDRTLLLTTP
jgi:hypothetical protein